jgi:uncharacterized protein
MLFALICTDAPNTAETRTTTRPPHVTWLEGLGKTLKFAGPFMTPDGSTPIGSLIVIEAADMAAARALAAQDPYAKAGLFATVDIRAWNWTRNNPDLAKA